MGIWLSLSLNDGRGNHDSTQAGEVKMEQAHVTRYGLRCRSADFSAGEMPKKHNTCAWGLCLQQKH